MAAKRSQVYDLAWVERCTRSFGFTKYLFYNDFHISTKLASQTSEPLEDRGVMGYMADTIDVIRSPDEKKQARKLGVGWAVSFYERGISGRMEGRMGRKEGI